MTDSSVNHLHTSEERLSRLEATVETFVLTVSRDIQEQNSSITALRQAIQEQNKTPWQNYIAAFGVLLVILAMYGSGFTDDQSKMEMDILKARDEFHAHSSDGHPDIALREMQMYRDADHVKMKELATDMLEMQEWRRKDLSENASAHATLSARVDFLIESEKRSWEMSHPETRAHRE